MKRLPITKSSASAIASAVAAVVLAATFAGRSCAVADDGPGATAQTFWAATRDRDVAAVYALLAPALRAELDQRASVATDLDGGRRRYQGIDMVRLDEPRAGASEFVVQAQSDTEAVVLVKTGGEQLTMTLVRIDERWYVAGQP